MYRVCNGQNAKNKNWSWGLWLEIPLLTLQFRLEYVHVNRLQRGRGWGQETLHHLILAEIKMWWEREGKDKVEKFPFRTASGMYPAIYSWLTLHMTHLFNSNKGLKWGKCKNMSSVFIWSAGWLDSYVLPYFCVLKGSEGNYQGQV